MQSRQRWSCRLSWAGLVSLLAGTSALGLHYDGTLVVPSNREPVLRESVQDAQRVLSNMTGRAFVVRAPDPSAPTGIILARADDQGVPAALVDRLNALPASGEAYVIAAEGTTRLWIVARTDLGLSRGLYRYLHWLGVRWYMHSRDFEIIPTRDSILFEGNLAEAPAFRGRHYFVSGAFGVATPVDPKIQPSADDAHFRRRNRFGGDFSAGGHDWENLVRRHQDVFREHPEYLALVKGRRVSFENAQGKFNYGVKFCVSNPALIELYARDTIERLKRRPTLLMVSVEPSDGGGFCECETCQAIGTGSASDQVFHLANEVARRVAAELPGKMVSLLAYHLHAAPPSFPLEPNVYVTVVPYAFQQTRYAPDELIQAWARLVQRQGLGVYDYWALPDGNRDMPTFDFVGRPVQRVRTWRAAGANSFMLETTLGAAVGPGLYLAAQLGWNPDLPVDALLSEFYRDCFGPAAGTMRELLEMWAQHFQLTPHVLGESYRLMARALEEADTATPDQRRRLYHYANYLHYVRLYYEYRRLARGTEERSRRTRDTIKWMWRIHDSRLIHTFRTQWMIRLHDEKDRPWIDDFHMREHDRPGWSEVLAEGPPSEAETREKIADGLAVYGRDAIRPAQPAGVVVPMNPDARPQYPELAFATHGYTRFIIHVPVGVTDVVVRAASLLPAGHANEKVRCFWLPADKESILAEVELTAEEQEIRLAVPRSGNYELRFLSMVRAPFRVQLPPLPVAATRFTPHQRMDLYFYVPPGTPRLVFKTGHAASKPFVLRDPTGREVEYRHEQIGNDHFYWADIPENATGVWCLSNYRNGQLLTMLTVPQLIGFSPDGVMTYR